jgi:hypothetical protein
MALSGRIKVPLPGRGIIVSHNPARPYVYKVLRTYRNAKGQPTNDCRSIGRLDPATGMLIPNDYYWQAYPTPPVEALPEPDSIRAIGSTFLVGRVLERLGVAGILQDALGPERARAALAVACYMARRGNVIDGITDWAQTSTLAGTPAPTPQSASRLFASITHPERMVFFRAWAAKRTAGGCLAYDVTSFSTYAEGLDAAEWGHNRDGDKLPQINYACYLDQATGLPVFYLTYPGSIIDKSHLPSMMAYNTDLGIHDVTFVMDRGFATTKNIAYMHDKPYSYILAVETRYKTARQAVDQVRDTIGAMRNRLPGGVCAQGVKGRFWGQPGTLHVFRDPALAELRRAELERRVQADEDELRQLEELTDRQAEHYRRRRFQVTLNEDGTFEWARDLDRIDEAGADAGFFCLLTDTDLTSRQTLEIYRRRDAIEKGFDELKNHVDMKRLRTWSDETTEGKMFCAFLALVAVCEIQAKARPVLKASKQSVSKKGLLAEMDKIKVVQAPSGVRLVNPATKLQRDVLEAVALTEEDLRSYATEK